MFGILTINREWNAGAPNAIQIMIESNSSSDSFALINKLSSYGADNDQVTDIRAISSDYTRYNIDIYIGGTFSIHSNHYYCKFVSFTNPTNIITTVSKITSTTYTARNTLNIRRQGDLKNKINEYYYRVAADNLRDFITKCCTYLKSYAHGSVPCIVDFVWANVFEFVGYGYWDNAKAILNLTNTNGARMYTACYTFSDSNLALREHLGTVV